MRSSRRTIITLGTLGLLATLIAIALYVKARPSASGSGAAHVLSGAPGAREGTRLSEVAGTGFDGSWRLLSQRTYVVDASTSLETKNAKQVEQALLTITLGAELTLTAVSVSPERVLRGELQRVSLAIGDGKTGAPSIELDAIRRSLGEVFFVSLRPGGGVEMVYIQKGANAQAENLIKTLVAATQFVLPETQLTDWTGAASWSTEESDTSGVFLAQYTRVDDTTFGKTKTYLTHTLSDLFGAERVKTTSSIKLNATARAEVDVASTDESVQVALDSGGFRSDTRVGLRTLRAQQLSSAAPPRLEGLVGSRLYERMSGDDPAARATLLDPGDSVQSVMRELSASNEHHQRFRLQSKLVELMQRDPRSAKDVSRQLSSADPKTQEMLLGALSDAATPEAQSELLGVARDSSRDSELRDAALANLALTSDATPETLSDLRTLSEDPNTAPNLKNTATLAVGATARAQVETEAGAEASTGAVAALVQKLEAEPAGGNQGLYLAALGNAGSAASLPAIERALSDPSEGVRAGATRALRFIPGAEAESLLIQTLTTSPDVSVRLAAVEACEYREITNALAPAILTALQKDPSPDVRKALIAVVANFRSKIPHSLETLNAVAQHDPSPDVREQATDVLLALDNAG